MKDLILIGGCDHCKSVLDAAESAGYNILGVLETIWFVDRVVNIPSSVRIKA